MAAIPPPLHPLVVAAQKLGFQEDVLVSLQAIGQEIDARAAALADETDPIAGLVERNAIITYLGATTAGVTVDTFAAWYAPLIRRLNGETRRLYPDWRTRPGLLLNEWSSVRGWA
jgi:hypothetical protein